MTIYGEKNRIVLGVTGSIAAYKAAELARRYIKAGFEVKTVLSPGAQDFIMPMTFSSITRNRVMTNFKQERSSKIGHIELADWAHVVVVAPATANFIAKYTAGIADNPLMAVLLATRSRVLVAPAMNVNMWNHEATQENVEILKDRGVFFAEPGEGPLACGWRGRGRMAEPWDIYYQTQRTLARDDYRNKKVVVVTGPTREAVDPVRFISNRSTGKMGVALARDAFRRGADVTVIHGPVRVKLPHGIKRVGVTSAEEMRAAALSHAFPEQGNQPDIVIMAAAVSDVRPKTVSELKMKRSDLPKSLGLTPNTDILAELGNKRAESDSRTVLVGFAVETGDEPELLIEEARRKLKDKKVDVIIGNFAHEAIASDTNRVWIVTKSGKQTEVATNFKSRIAEKILNNVKKL